MTDGASTSTDLVRATRPARPTPVRLGVLAALVGHRPGGRLDGGADVLVSGVTLDSRRVLPGDLYAALPGARAHGADFADAALACGAAAVLTDEAGARTVAGRAPVLVVEQPRAVLGAVSARVYDHPATAMRMIGVTGTQGKTTTTRILEGGLQSVGTTAAVIGTVGTRVGGRDVRTALTTPEAPDLHGLFARMREHHVDTCAMEVSSHALVMGRVDGVVFDVATFLNLGRDHLDFHPTTEDYFAAKASLFTPERARQGLACADDAHGRRLLDEAAIPMSSYALDGDADWRAVDLEPGPDGTRFVVRGPAGLELPASVALPGRFNVANALAAIASSALAGLDPAAVATGIAAGGGVPGRLERVAAGQDFTLVVDYAHKPDAVEAVLTTLRPLTEGRLLVVIGAGGDRDPGKRPLMGEIAARLADVLVVTDDNPRSEDPASIRAALLEGARSGRAEVVEQGDRRLAIREAVARAEPGDVVLVAGKGHETGQEVLGEVHPFDDRAVAAEEVRRR